MLETMSELREANMDILRKFDGFCNSHGIRYFISFGTLLGAVRHQDFIPWDDDLDITMLREDYERLAAIPAEEYPAGCSLVEPGHDGMFCGFTPMFKDDNYSGKMIKGTDYDDGTGIGRLGIDIFVLDPSYRGLRHTILTYRQYMLYAEARAYRPVPKPLDTKKPKIIAVPLVKIFQAIGRRKSLDRILSKYWRITLNLKTDGRTLYSPCNLPHEFCHEYKAEWFKDTVYLRLGDGEFPAPSGYKELMEVYFGDYMQLPPEEKRVPEHFVLKEYQGQ